VLREFRWPNRSRQWTATRAIDPHCCHWSATMTTTMVAADSTCSFSSSSSFCHCCRRCCCCCCCWTMASRRRYCPQHFRHSCRVLRDLWLFWKSLLLRRVIVVLVVVLAVVVVLVRIRRLVVCLQSRVLRDRPSTPSESQHLWETPVAMDPDCVAVVGWNCAWMTVVWWLGTTTTTTTWVVWWLVASSFSSSSFSYYC